MRNKLLSFLGMVLMTISANASVDGWAAPSYTTTNEYVPEVAVLHLVGKDVFLTAGGTWGSHAAITTDLSKAFLYNMLEQANGYNLISDQAANQKKLGRQSEKDLYTDYNNQTGWGLYYAFTQCQSGNWKITTSEDDPSWGSGLFAGWEDLDEGDEKEAMKLKWQQSQYVLGWDPTNEDSFQGGDQVMYEDDGVTPKNVNILMLDPEREDFADCYAEWDFIDEISYLAYTYQGKIIALIEEVIAEGLEDYGVDYEAYHDAYDSGDVDQIIEAEEELEAVVAKAKQDKAFSSATQDNPQDATFMLENPAFDAGNISGWTCTFVSGQNANNVGYQQGGNGYTNGNIKVWKFIEAWSNSTFNPNVTYRAIGDGKLSQTIENMPQGKYKFTCDCIAVQQDGQSDPVTGVELFAIGGTLDVFTNLSTGNGVPEHFELTFVNTGGDVEIGLRTNNATANWIAADNFTLTYYGPVTDDPQKVLLDGAISSYESAYPDLDEVYAYNETKTAYSDELAAAKAVSADGESQSEDYTAAKEALDAAAAALAASVSEYASFKTYIDNTLTAKIADVSNFGWAALATTLADYKSTLNRAYNDGTYSSEDIAGVAAQVTTLIGEYISTNCQEGDDITILIENAGFSAAQTWNGWTKTNYDGTGNISAGNHRWGGQNVNYPVGFELESGAVTEEFTADDGCVEIWRGAFKYSQTISQMPAGLYTLSCKGFWRNEDNQADVTAAANAPELFAIYDKDGVEQVQTQKFTNIFRDCTDAMLYNGGSANGTMAYGGGTGQEQDKNEAAPASGKYYPNGMCGASAHFAAGGYKQEFNFVLTTTTDVVIGARSQGANYWTLFDDFQLVYQGNGAAAYYDLIQGLMTTAADKRDNTEAGFVDELYNELNDAYDAGSNALSGGTSEDCMAAVEALQTAIANAEAGAAKVQEMLDLMEELEDELMNLVSSSDTELPALIEEITSAHDNYEIADLAAIDQYINDLKAGFTNYVMVDIVDLADEDNPQDASCVILNPDFATGNTDKWTFTTGGKNFGYGYAEYYNTAFRFSQTLYGLPAGWYVLGVKAFYRCGWPSNVQTAIDETTDKNDLKNVTLFAGATATPALLVQNQEDMEAITALIGTTQTYVDGSSQLTFNKETVDEVNYRIPNNMETAGLAFDNDLYQNYLLFEVENDGDDVEIGLEKVAEVGYDWTMFGDWTLEYLGTAQPSVDPTTAIQSIETAPVAAKAAIYNLAGQRVSKATKGIYIINGKKVVIK